MSRGQSDKDLPDELRWLGNMINAADEQMDISILRRAIHSCVDEAPPYAVIAMAKYIYDEGAKIHRAGMN